MGQFSLAHHLLTGDARTQPVKSSIKAEPTLSEKILEKVNQKRSLCCILNRGQPRRWHELQHHENEALYAFRTFGDTALRFAVCCTQNRAEAEDIVQDVLLMLHTAPRQFESDEHMKAWLLRAIRDRAKNYHLRCRRKAAAESAETGATADWHDFTEDYALRELVFSLPAKQSTVLYLYYYEGYRTAEIAAMLGEKENTVRTWLKRGRKRLQLELENTTD